MKSPSALLQDLRKTLGTRSLRRWFREDFVLRTKIAMEQVPKLFAHAYTVRSTYTVRLYEDGEYVDLEMTEEQIRDEFGDRAFEDAEAQVRTGEDAYVRLSDYATPEDYFDYDDAYQQWGVWSMPGTEDEPN